MTHILTQFYDNSTESTIHIKKLSFIQMNNNHTFSKKKIFKQQIIPINSTQKYESLLQYFITVDLIGHLQLID